MRSVRLLSECFVGYPLLSQFVGLEDGVQNRHLSFPPELEEPWERDSSCPLTPQTGKMPFLVKFAAGPLRPNLHLAIADREFVNISVCNHLREPRTDRHRDFPKSLPISPVRKISN